jgi:Family of unknown function (DUF5335)
MSTTEEIPRQSWESYFDDLSNRLGTARATLEVDGRDVGAQIAAEDLLFGGITYENRDDLLVIALDVPGGAPAEYEHLIDAPQRIFVETGDELDTTIDIQDGEERQTLLRLEPAPELPPGS